MDVAVGGRLVRCGGGKVLMPDLRIGGLGMRGGRRGRECQRVE